MTETQQIKKSHMDNVFNTETMLPFSEIRGNTVIMKDGSLRGIVQVTWLNLDLKNYDEQAVIIEQYKKFLNWLDFPVQILVRNAYLDLSPYLNVMRWWIKKLENPVLHEQWEKYIKFLEDIEIQQGLIYTKEFYCIIPFYAEWGGENSQINKWRLGKFLSALESKDSPEKIIERYRNYNKNKKFLDTRCNLIQDWLNSLGMETERLNTSEIISLLFKFYNPTLHNAQASE